MQGFFHTTGHGIGLEIHEKLRIGPAGDPLKAGNIMSVEPGLYYKGIGGVRIEDLVHVTKSGCDILAGYPKRLEIR
jgi:Xaa-Pro aminopeptidase